jgi:hypothetical protein
MIDPVPTIDPTEEPTGLLSPAILLPAQFFTTSSKAVDSGEKRLMLAVLEEAVVTLHRHFNDTTCDSRRAFLEVERWVRCTDDSSWPFAFENICEALKLDAERLRQGLEAWKESQRQSRDRPASEPPWCSSRDRRGHRSR